MRHSFLAHATLLTLLSAFSLGCDSSSDDSKMESDKGINASTSNDSTSEVDADTDTQGASTSMEGKLPFCEVNVMTQWWPYDELECFMCEIIDTSTASTVDIPSSACLTSPALECVLIIEEPSPMKFTMNPPPISFADDSRIIA